MGGTVVGQYTNTREFYCTRCGGGLRQCVIEWDYCPAGSDVVKYAFCKKCLTYMLSLFNG